MATAIGIFEREHDVLRAVGMLRDAGLHNDDVRVLVSNLEQAPLLRGENHLPLEEMNEIQAERLNGPGEGNRITGFPLVAGFTGGTIAGGATASAIGFGFVNGDFDIGDEAGMKSALAAIGIPDDATGACSEAIGAGRFVVVAESVSGVQADSLLRRAGASDVLL